MTTEFWTCRVLLHRNGRPMRVGDNTSDIPANVIARVVAGEFVCIPPNNDIAEPINCHATEAEANAERERLKADDPATDYRVVLNTDGL